MDRFTYVVMMIMIALAVCSSPLSGLEFTITNGPQDTTVCMNDMAECTCGFDGANPAITIPDWIIITRSSDGSVTSNATIDGRDIIDNKHDGLVWQFGDVNTTSSPNSKLVVGPVDETHNQSSYQCVFRLNEIINESIQLRTIKSSVGTLTVVGPPSIGYIVVDETCATSLSISWDTHIHPVCRVVSQLVTISSNKTSGAITFPANDNNFTFTNLNSNTSYDVTITLRYKRVQTRTRSTVIKTPPSHSPPVVFDIVTNAENDDIKITWKVPEINCSVAEITHYNVTILTKGASKSRIVTEEVVYLSNFLVYQSNISYTVIITAINSQGSSEPASKTIGIKNTMIQHNDKDDDDECSGMMIGFTVTIVVLVVIIIGITAVMMWCLYKHKREEAVIPKTLQLTEDTIKMQSSPAYVPMSQDNIKPSTVPQYETIQHCNDVRMDTNPAYLTHKNT